MRIKSTLDHFKEILKSRYLFHLHTNYTDGQLSVRDYFDFADKVEINTLIFTEHVRRDLTYSFDAFVDEIEAVGSEYQSVNYLIGAEAKILPEKELDISKDTLDKIDLLAIACHSFPDDVDLYFDCLEHIFSKDWKKIAVFVHPGRFFKRRKIYQQKNRFQKVVDLAVRNGIFIEENKRENLPVKGIFIRGSHKIIGFDVHTNKEFEKVQNFYL